MKRLVHLGPWRVERTLGHDLCGTYYSGHRASGDERATLYLLSNELAATRDEPLSRLLELHHNPGHPSLVRFRGLDRDNHNRYLIADAVDDTLASLRGSRRPAPGQTRVLGVTLAAALAAAHDRGLVHGGLELSNTLWAPDRAPQILGTGVAALGLPDRVAAAHGDVAALGRLLCTLVASWPHHGISGADNRTSELVRVLADPGAAISMREAHAMFAALLATDEQTQVARIAGSSSGPPTANGRRPRQPSTREGLAISDTAQTEDYLPDEPSPGASGPRRSRLHPSLPAATSVATAS